MGSTIIMKKGNEPVTDTVQVSSRVYVNSNSLGSNPRHRIRLTY